MNHKYIQKYYYHQYVIFLLAILLISLTYSVIYSNFNPTDTVIIFGLISAIIGYIALFSFFLYLYKQQDWIIPRTWRNVKNRPILYLFVIFPLCIITILWGNFSLFLPSIYTSLVGKPSVVKVPAMADYSSFKGQHYFLKSPYQPTRVFRIDHAQFQYYSGHQLDLELSIVSSPLGTQIRKVHRISIQKKTTPQE